MKLKMIIIGSKVHNVGYRVMFVNKVLSLGVSNFNVFNTFIQGKQSVFALIEGDEEALGEFKAFANTVKPDEADVENISFEEYRNTVPPIERCMQAFQMEQWGRGIPILLKMLEKQDSMLEKQDTTIGVLKSVKEDTAYIPAMREDIAEVKSHTSLIPAMKEDTSEIKSNTREIVDKLQNKYEELSKEIAQMKVTLAKIETKVFA